MKIILSSLFIAIFSIMAIAQQEIGVTFVIKKGETAKAGRLQLKYLGSLKEWAYGWGEGGKRFENEYLRYHFEVTDDNKKQEFQEISSFKSNGLVIEIIEKVSDTDAVKIVVLTEKQFGEKVLKKAEIQMAFDELSKIKTFALGSTGYAGITSQGEILMLKILENESAKSKFIWMLEIGTNEAKLYALYGLRRLDKKESVRFFEKYHDFSADVQTMSGCEISTEKFSHVVAQIEKMR